ERNQFLSQRGHAFGRPVAIANLQRGVASFQIAEIAQAGSKPRNVARRRCGGEGRENADERADLLRPRRQRPCGRRAAEQRDEIATAHSITSSARRMNDSGIVSPAAFAVFKLMLRSNLTGSSTGSSASLVPRKILSTYEAPRRNKSGRLAP